MLCVAFFPGRWWIRARGPAIDRPLPWRERDDGSGAKRFRFGCKAKQGGLEAEGEPRSAWNPIVVGLGRHQSPHAMLCYASQDSKLKDQSYSGRPDPDGTAQVSVSWCRFVSRHMHRQLVSAVGALSPLDYASGVAVEL